MALQGATDATMEGNTLNMLTDHSTASQANLLSCSCCVTSLINCTVDHPTPPLQHTHIQSHGLHGFVFLLTAKAIARTELLAIANSLSLSHTHTHTHTRTHTRAHARCQARTAQPGRMAWIL
jgi:hypothetical protein